MTQDTDATPTDEQSTVETVRLTDGDTETYMNAHEFVELLDSVERATTSIERIQREVENLNTGLEEEDCIRLIYGRTQFSLSDVRGFFDTLDTIEGANERKLLKRLLADLGNERLENADEFLEEVERLRKRYGDLAEGGADDG